MGNRINSRISLRETERSRSGGRRWWRQFSGWQICLVSVPSHDWCATVQEVTTRSAYVSDFLCDGRYTSLPHDTDATHRAILCYVSVSVCPYACQTQVLHGNGWTDKTSFWYSGSLSVSYMGTLNFELNRFFNCSAYDFFMITRPM